MVKRRNRATVKLNHPWRKSYKVEQREKTWKDLERENRREKALAKE